MPSIDSCLLVFFLFLAKTIETVKCAVLLLWYRESSYQPIIPGLPDDLGLRCLAKIPHGYHGCLETVSKRWRDVVHSTEYSRYKAKEGWSGDWVFLRTHNNKDQWIAYDPDADRWHPIPMIPGWDEYAWSKGFGCVCVANKFLVIGEYYCTSPEWSDERPFMTKVFQFDTFTKQWSEAANMRTSRAYFGCCVMSGKVYVCGGRNVSHLNGLVLAEVYDPLTNKWEELPKMRNNLMNCLSLSHDGNLYAFTDNRPGNVQPRNYTPLRSYRTQIFDASNQVWRTEQMNWPCLRVGRAQVQVTEDGGVYAYVCVGDGNMVKTKDNRGEWHDVAKLPPLTRPRHGLSRGGEVDLNGFVALGNELYVIGGTISTGVGRGVLEPTIKSLESDRCWIWDGKWRETRPLCRPSRGAVKAFAALKEKNMSLPLDMGEP